LSAEVCHFYYKGNKEVLRDREEKGGGRQKALRKREREREGSVRVCACLSEREEGFTERKRVI
jgi:hypothetical protein